MIESRGGRRDEEGCALLLIDYQDNVLAEVPEPAKVMVERNVCAIAIAALQSGVPVVVTTLGVEIGVGSPTIPSLRSALPGVEPIDRSCMNAWDDMAVLDAVEMVGRRTWVMAGIVTSVGLTYPALCALAEGNNVLFIEDAVADITDPFHQAAVARLVRAGGTPRSTQGLISAWAQARWPRCDGTRSIGSSRAGRSERRAA
jgi:nicotinamidase-related amidase